MKSQDEQSTQRGTLPVPSGLSGAHAEVFRLWHASGREAAVGYSMKHFGTTEKAAAEFVDKLMEYAAKHPAAPQAEPAEDPPSTGQATITSPEPMSGGVLATIFEVFAVLQCIGGLITVFMAIAGAVGGMMLWAFSLVGSALVYFAIATVIRILLRIEINTRKTP